MWIYLCLLMCSLSGVYSYPQKNSEQMPDRKEILKSVDKLLKSPDRYHKVATLSLLTGALQAERKMEFALNKLAEDFYDNFNKSSLQENEKKLKEISKFVQRDLRSMFILNNALDVASKNFSKSEFDKAIKDMTIRNERHAPKIGPNILKESHNPVESVKKFLSNHVNSIRTKLFNKVKHTVDHLNGAKEKVKDKISSHKKSKKSKDNSLLVESIKHEQDLFPAYLPNDPFSSFDTDPYLFAPYQEEIRKQLSKRGRKRRQRDSDEESDSLNEISSESDSNESEYSESDSDSRPDMDLDAESGNDRDDDDDEEEDSPIRVPDEEEEVDEREEKQEEEMAEDEAEEKEEKEEEEEDEDEPEKIKVTPSISKAESDSDEFDLIEEAGRPGGLVGLIASLSGGDEGSDVGALFGSLSGVVTNLFGPDGLDINSLLSSGTSLIAGLLGGDKNFGKVLSTYIGTSLDGFSGGGGADNNGLFVGNLLGGVLAEMSANPEDEDLPPRPDIFVKKLIEGFGDGLRRDGAADVEEASTPGKPDGSAGFFGFITRIVKAVVGGVTSFILNASLGSSGGASQGAAELSSGASGASSSGSDSSTHDKY